MSASRHKAINPITSAGIENNQKVAFGDFPGSPVLKNLPSNERDVGLIHGQGTKIPHASGQLNLHAPTTEFIMPQQRPKAAQNK